MKKLTYVLTAILISLSYTGINIYAATSVQNVKVQQRYPWNGLVDIDYEIVSDKPAETDFYVYVTVKDNDLNRFIAPRSLVGEGTPGIPVKKGTHRVTWNMGADEPGIHSSALSASIHASTAVPYMVIDLSGGPNAESYPVRYSSTAPNLNDDTCRTTELWLRFIQPGTFMMGSPTDEVSRGNNETLHQVTLTKPYYLGIFEVTQKQWELVMGNNNAYYKGDTRPADSISYDMIRGAVTGRGWPTNGQVDADSFMGKMRTKTAGVFDLPTEAQWEYACRAGTSTAFNNGKGVPYNTNLAEVGRFNGNQSDGKGGYTQYTKVGSYLPNAWGLYDMHGNVYEWCLDFLNSDHPSTSQTDPIGSTGGSYRIIRGGRWWDGAVNSRSAYRGGLSSDRVSPGTGYNDIGFRVAIISALKIQ